MNASRGHRHVSRPNAPSQHDNATIEFGAYTQCTAPHALYLKVVLQRWDPSRLKWRDAYVATGSLQMGYLLNVVRNPGCTGSTKRLYRMKTWAEADGSPMNPYPATGDPVEIACTRAFLTDQLVTV